MSFKCLLGKRSSAAERAPKELDPQESWCSNRRRFYVGWIGLKLLENATDTKFAEVVFPGSTPRESLFLEEM